MLNVLRRTSALAALAWIAPAALAQAVVQFDLPAQPLADSLRAVGSQTNLNVLFDPPLVAAHQAPALKAQLTADQALVALLAGTGIQREFLNDTTVVLANAEGKKPLGDAATKRISNVQTVRLAQAGQEGTTPSATQSAASEPASGMLEEVVVSARKKMEGLQDVPIAVSAYDAKQLEALGVTDTADIAALTPNFTWKTEFGKASPQPYLRGVGTNNFAPNNTRPVAIYQDDVFIGANPAQGFSAFDLERVEVLKGPQGTLYGRNATAGLVNFIARKPEIAEPVNGFVAVELGRFATTNVEAAVGGPLGDATAARLAINFDRNDGIIKNSNPSSGVERSGRTDDLSGRLQVLHDFGPSTLLLNAHFSRSEPDTHPFKTLGLVCPPGVTVPRFGVCQTRFGVADEFVDSADLHETFHQDDREHVETQGAFARLDMDIGAMTLTSLTAYDHTELQRFDDIDETPQSIEFDHYNDEFDIVSQELRLAGRFERGDWQVGANYYREDYDGFLNFDTPAFGSGVGNIKEIDTTAWAVFAEGGYSITERLRLNVGARYTHEKKEVPLYRAYTTITPATRDTFYSRFEEQQINQIVFDTTAEDSWKNVSGRVSLDYKLATDILVYVSASRGFRGGDVNGVALVDPEAVKPADPETLDAVEIGFKGDLFDNTLRLNLAAFHYDYKDQQLVSVSEGALAVGVTTLNNVGRSKIKGFEMDVLWAATDALRLNAAVGLLDATFDEFFFNATTDLSGNRIPFTSEIEVSGIATYDFELANGGGIRLLGMVNYFGDQFFEAENRPELFQDDYAVVNAALTYSAPSDAWSITARVDNLTDKEYFTSGFNLDFFGAQALKAGEQRYYGVEMRLNF